MTHLTKRLALLCLFLPVIALAQIPTTPNIGLQIPPYGTANWNTPVNYNSTQLDLFLSGNLPLPALRVTGALTAPGLTTWNSVTSYDSGSVVFYFGTLYQSLTSGNLGNVPSTSTSNWSSTIGGAAGINSLLITVPSWLTAPASPLTGPGTIAITTPSQTANQFLASPNGASGALSPRAIVAADLPVATTSAPGIVQPDGTSITISGAGVISAASAMTLIQKQVITVNTNGVTFSNIPQTFSHLQLMIAGPATGDTSSVTLNFNGDSTQGNYNFNFMNASNGGVSSSYNNNYSSIQLGSLGLSSAFSMIKVTIPSYALTTINKGLIAEGTFVRTNPGYDNSLFGGWWNSQAAITSITINCSDFAPGAIISLYGLQ